MSQKYNVLIEEVKKLSTEEKEMTLSTISNFLLSLRVLCALCGNLLLILQTFYKEKYYGLSTTATAPITSE